MKKNAFLAVMAAVMFVILVVLILRMPSRIAANYPGEQKVWTDRDQLEYANMLLAKGLNKEAAAALEEYTVKSGAERKKLAKLYYRVGNIYMDMCKYEKALCSFYKADLLGAESGFKNEMNRKIVEALEKTGMSSQAQYELKSRTAMREPVKKEGRIVAIIGSESITEPEIDSAMDKMPEWMKKNFETEEGRKHFIRQYAANEALYRKAKRLGLDKSPETRKAIDDFSKQVIIEQLVNDEIGEKLKINPQDLKLYYEANKDRYIMPEAVKISYIELKKKSRKEKDIAGLKEGKGTKVDKWIETSEIAIPGLGEAKDVVDNLLGKEKGDITRPFEVGEKLYIFKIDAKRQREEKTYKEVERQIEYEYMARKQQELINSLLEKVMQEEKVKIL